MQSRREEVHLHGDCGAKRRGRKIWICAHAPSNYPAFARFLVEEGIDSISLNPDAVIKTTLDVFNLEQTLAKR